MGKWTFRKFEQPLPHAHDYPRYNDNREDIRVGDVWECGCGEEFTVTRVVQAHDGTALVWAEGNFEL